MCKKSILTSIFLGKEAKVLETHIGYPSIVFPIAKEQNVY